MHRKPSARSTQEAKIFRADGSTSTMATVMVTSGFYSRGRKKDCPVFLGQWRGGVGWRAGVSWVRFHRQGELHPRAPAGPAFHGTLAADFLEPLAHVDQAVAEGRARPFAVAGPGASR